MQLYIACSGGVVVVALKDLGACEFSVRRPRGGRSVVLLSSFHPQFDDSFTSTNLRCTLVRLNYNAGKTTWEGGGGLRESDCIDSAGRTRMGGDGCEQMCTLHTVVLLWLWH